VSAQGFDRRAPESALRVDADKVGQQPQLPVRQERGAPTVCAAAQNRQQTHPRFITDTGVFVVCARSSAAEEEELGVSQAIARGSGRLRTMTRLGKKFRNADTTAAVSAARALGEQWGASDW
jgi:hypothetical protein